VQLGLNLAYWSGGPDADALALARLADELGVAVVWAAEAYGSDAASVLAWVGAHTRHIDIGSAVFQIPARSPAMTAMTAATLDGLSGGRFRLGLGVSGPQVSEGWHGVPFAAPLARTREYVEVVRLALSRAPVAHPGTHYPLPLPGGAGKALRLTVHPVREHIPIYLAAIGPRNLALAGEVADGALVVFFAPEHADEFWDPLQRGLDLAGRSRDTFDLAPTVPLVIGEDLAACAAPVAAYSALYLGGMGSREKNFYNALATRMGFGEAAARVQELYLDRQPREAAAAVPVDFLRATALIGTREQVAARLGAYAAAGVGTLSVAPMGATPARRAADLATVAELLA